MGEKGIVSQHPWLSVYAVEQNMPAVTIYRRSKEDFIREAYEGLDAVIPLPAAEIDLPLADIYIWRSIQAGS
jgi:hypothetical protein